MPAEKISLEHAKIDKLMYFVANAVIYRASDARCFKCIDGIAKEVTQTIEFFSK